MLEETGLHKSSIISSYKPTQLLVLYKAEIDKNEYRPERPEDSRYYIEQHSIIQTGPSYVALAGQPMQVKQVEAIFKALVEEQGTDIGFKDIIPENVLFVQLGAFNKKVIWWEPAQTRTMFFNENLGMGSSFTCAMPPMLFMVVQEKIYVYALQENQRPVASTPVCYLPLPNIYNDGKVCMGTAMVREEHEHVEELIEDYSHAFWNSEFNVHHATTMQFKGSLLQHMKELDGRAFDTSLLVPITNKTIHSLIHAKTYYQ